MPVVSSLKSRLCCFIIFFILSLALSGLEFGNAAVQSTVAYDECVTGGTLVARMTEKLMAKANDAVEILTSSCPSNEIQLLFTWCDDPALSATAIFIIFSPPHS